MKERDARIFRRAVVEANDLLKTEHMERKTAVCSRKPRLPVFSVFSLLLTFGRSDGLRRPDAHKCRPSLVPFRVPMQGPCYPKRYQHLEEKEETADAQPAPGGGGDTEAR